MKDRKLSRKQQSRLAATKGGQAFARKCLLAKVETNLKEVVYSSTDIAKLTPDEQAIAMEKCKEVLFGYWKTINKQFVQNLMVHLLWYLD